MTDNNDMTDKTGKNQKGAGGCGASCGCGGKTRTAPETQAEAKAEAVEQFLHSQRLSHVAVPDGMAERILARAAREPRNVYAPLRGRGVWGRVLQAGRDIFTPNASRSHGFGAGWLRPAFAFAMVAVMMAAVFFAPDAGYSGLSKPAEQQIVALDAGGGADGLLSVADRGLALEVLTEGDLDLFELAYAEPAYVEPNVSATDIRGDLDDLILQDMEDVFL